MVSLDIYKKEVNLLIEKNEKKAILLIRVWQIDVKHII